MTTTADSVEMSDVQPGPSAADQMCERLFGATIGMTDLLSIYLGDRLGLYAALQDLATATSTTLASRAGIHERYAREWLAHQAASGFIEVAAAAVDDAERAYRLTPDYVPVFLDKDDLVHIIPVVRSFVAAVRMIDPITEAFRTGGGVPWSEFGPDGIEGQEGFNRAAFAHLLGSEWLPAIPSVHERLGAPGTRLVDVACGGARSSIAIARAYPELAIDAVDNDPMSIDLARRNVRDAGLEQRINVRLADGTSVDGAFDVATIFEAVHDLSDPVGVLRAVHRSLKPGGVLLVVDENVGEEFNAPAEGLDAFFYGASLLICLPAGMAEQPSAGTGTVMRPSTFAQYAREAGFDAVETAAIDYPFFRFYVLQK